MQRLESITIHWTRQIKEVVNQQVRSGNNVNDAESRSEKLSLAITALHQVNAAWCTFCRTKMVQPNMLGLWLKLNSGDHAL